MSHSYLYCGLVIESDESMPELQHATADQRPQIAISRGLVEIPRDQDLYAGPNWVIGQLEAFWWLKGVACFHIRADRIVVDSKSNSDPGLVRALLLEGPMIMAMIYRGEFCLRAAAVSDGSRAIAICGMASGGKSTAAAFAVTRGQRLVSDNLLRITFSENCTPLAWPQGNGALLWPRSIALLGLDEVPSQCVRKELSLRRVHLPCQSAPVPLEEMHLLRRHSQIPLQLPVPFQARSARQTFGNIGLLTAGRLWVDQARRTHEHFIWSHSLASKCRMQEASNELIFRGHGSLRKRTM